MPIVTETPSRAEAGFRTATGFIVTPDVGPDTHFGKSNATKFELTKHGIGPKIQDAIDSIDGNCEGVAIISTDHFERVSFARTTVAEKCITNGTHRLATEEQIKQFRVDQTKRDEQCATATASIRASEGRADPTAAIQKLAEATQALAQNSAGASARSNGKTPAEKAS